MIKKFTIVVIVSTIIGLIFLGYMYFIGIPKTQARNFYNLALEAENNGDLSKAIEYLNIAKEYWMEEYISTKLSDLQN